MLCLLKYTSFNSSMGFLGSLEVKTLPANAKATETCVSSFSWEDPLEEGLATHSSTLVWRIPWTEELAGYSPWGDKQSDTTEHAHTHITAAAAAKLLQSCSILCEPIDGSPPGSTCQIVDVLPHGELTE